ncbi:hypothetical protein COF77_30960 [Bacillus wiedmannii]|nr:hypothetical protein COF77_30960 [Bacillus wiedmannii]
MGKMESEKVQNINTAIYRKRDLSFIKHALCKIYKPEEARFYISKNIKLIILILEKVLSEKNER